MIEHDPNMVQCIQCGQFLNSEHDGATKIDSGYIHDECLEDYCKDETISNNHAHDFAMEHFDEFKEFVRDAS